MRIANVTTGLATTAVALTFGDERVELILRALPYGFDDRVRDRIPDPVPPAKGIALDKRKRVVRDESGRPVTRYDLHDPAYQAAVRNTATRRNLLRLAKALEGEPKIAFDAEAPPDDAGPEAWMAYADALATEFAEAGFSEGQMLDLLARMMEVCGFRSDELEAAREAFLPQE